MADKLCVSMIILPTHYTTLVKPAFEEFCLPTKKYADVIVLVSFDNIYELPPKFTIISAKTHHDIIKS